MSPSGLVVLVALGVSQPMTRANALDPYLWAEITAAVEEAAEAELDPRRGPDNAVQILQAAKARHGSSRLRTALDLRTAGVSLRKHFRTSPQFAEPAREAQALSTYSRLDLTEPGLKVAIKRAVRAHREAVHANGKEPDHAPLELKAAVLARNPSFDKKGFIKTLSQSLKTAGAKLTIVPVKKAPFILKVGARGSEAKGSARLATVTLDLQQIEGGERVWEHALFRTSSAPTAEAATRASIQWLARVGGRDLLFRFLAEGPVPELLVLVQSSRQDGHHHHHHH